MIRRYLQFLLPALIVSTVILDQVGLLHIGYLYIKSHELRWTMLDYNYHPKDGDIFTAGESVSQNNYEDAILAFQPRYDRLLQRDLDEIAANRKHIDSIDRTDLSFYSGNYIVKVNLDKKDITIKDSTLFKKLVNVEIVGRYELYDAKGCHLLYKHSGRKFWIRDKIIMRGRSKQEFIINKIEEIWLAQISNHAHHIISIYEQPKELAQWSQELDDLYHFIDEMNNPLDDPHYNVIESSSEAIDATKVHFTSDSN